MIMACSCYSVFKTSRMINTNLTSTTANNIYGSRISSPIPAVPLPPVSINSSWIGNQWIPSPGYRVHSTREMQDYFQQHSILFVGDSTARRAYGTLYSILNTRNNPDDVSVHSIDDANIIDLNRKGQKTESCHKKGYDLCRQMPGNSSNQYDMHHATCLVDLANMAKDRSSPLWSEWIKNYSLVIFVLGPHEMMDRCADRHGRKNQTDILFNEIFQIDDILETNTTFLWRTWGIQGTTQERFSKFRGQEENLWSMARAHNKYVETLVDDNEKSRKEAGTGMGTVSYLDWAQAMVPRLWPTNIRIGGDIDAHYGLDARMSFVQMLLNHLLERDRQKRLNIHPWILTERAYNYSSDDPQHFMTIAKPYKVFTSKERDILETAKLSFCGSCIWNNGVSCADRVEYIQVTYNQDEMVSILAVMEIAACNTSMIENSTMG